VYGKLLIYCFSRNYRLPVIYVFQKRHIEIADAAQKLLQSYITSGVSPKTVVLRHDVAYTHAAGVSGGTTTYVICQPFCRKSSIGSARPLCNSRYLRFIPGHPTASRSINHLYSSSTREGKCGSHRGSGSSFGLLRG
jgi:hypothetical protein